MRALGPYWGANNPTVNFWNEMDKVFDEFFVPYRYSDTSGLQTQADVVEEESHFYLGLDLPGFKKEDIKIDVTDNVLTVSGERKGERRQGTFRRTFSLPTTIDTQKIEVQYENGVLEFILPKKEASRPRTIEIQSGKKGFFDKWLTSSRGTKEVNPSTQNGAKLDS